MPSQNTHPYSFCTAACALPELCGSSLSAPVLLPVLVSHRIRCQGRIRRLTCLNHCRYRAKTTLAMLPEWSSAWVLMAPGQWM